VQRIKDEIAVGQRVVIEEYTAHGPLLQPGAYGFPAGTGMTR
jgi:hypothetical protein